MKQKAAVGPCDTTPAPGLLTEAYGSQAPTLPNSMEAGTQRPVQVLDGIVSLFGGLRFSQELYFKGGSHPWGCDLKLLGTVSNVLVKPLQVSVEASLGKGSGELQRRLRKENLFHQSGPTFRRKAQKGVTTTGADSWRPRTSLPLDLKQDFQIQSWLTSLRPYDLRSILCTETWSPCQQDGSQLPQLHHRKL